MMIVLGFFSEKSLLIRKGHATCIIELRKIPRHSERTTSICYKSIFMNSAIHSRMIYWNLCVRLFARC